MFWNNVKVSFRVLKRNPFYSFISIAGLAIGLCACLTLVNYTLREKSYDSFHTDKDQIYRIESFFKRNGQVTDSWASSSFGYASAMKSEFPEVRDITRVNNYDCERIVRYKTNIYRESRAVLADSNFFSFFSYPLSVGDPKEVLRQPNSVVISESAARKYFHGDDPIGKIMTISTLKTKYDCAVTGVFKDFPKNSNLQLNLLVSYMSSSEWERESWYMHEAYTYVKLNSESDVVAVQKRFPALAEKYKTEPAFKEHQWEIELVPISNIHLNPAKTYELEAKASAGTINMLFIIAFVVLLISWINYINLFVSRAMERAGEIGVRKMAGANFRHILLQFIAESLMMNFISLVVFLALMLTIIPIASWFSLSDVFYGFWQNLYTWIIIGVIFLAGTILTGLMPAIVLKHLNAVEVLKNKLAFRSGLGNNLRKGLIVFQYFSSVVLIISTLTISKQISFMQSKDLGIAASGTIVFKTPPKIDGGDSSRMQSLVNGLKQINGVRYVTQSSAIPGKMVGYGMANRRAGDPERTNKMCEMFRVDYDFIPAYKMQLVKGRNFSKEFTTDQEDAVILTENAMQLFGFHNADEAINGAIHLEGHEERRFQVIGVVKDYHHLSLKEGFRPIVFMMYDPWKWINNHFVSVKVNQSTGMQLINSVKTRFTNIFPESSFDYFLLEDYFNKQYEQDIRYRKFVVVLTVLALIIVTLGIISMTAFMLVKRRKEIGIRKVNGAGTFHILKLLNSQFVKLVLFAVLAAIPAAWLTMQNWLQNFAFRTTVDGWIISSSVVIIFGVTTMTVSLLSYKTAVRKPVDALRSE